MVCVQVNVDLSISEVNKLTSWKEKIEFGFAIDSRVISTSRPGPSIGFANGST